MSTEFSFPHVVRVLVPSQVVTVQVNARIPFPGASAEIGFSSIPVGISAEGMSKLALQYYDIAARAGEMGIERQTEIEFERREAGIAGTEPVEEAV